MVDESYKDRKHLTFEQAEGVAAIPGQLQLKELSQRLRSLLWVAVYEEFERFEAYPDEFVGGSPYLRDPWGRIFYDMHVYRHGRMADEFENHSKRLIEGAKKVFIGGDYVAVFGWLQWVMRHPRCPYDLADKIDRALRAAQAAYRVLDRNTIVPIGSDAEKSAIERVFADVAAAEFGGARAHLRKAAEEMTAGRYADSIRESIHAVVSVARVLEPSANTLGPALAKLEKSAAIHGALKADFASIYGYTSDEKGIRHELITGANPKVDETDALFMIGACAAFVSYLINKGRRAGLLKSSGK